MSRGYSVAETARLVCALRWICSRVSEVLEVWAAQAAVTPEHAEAAASLSELSRRLASHRIALDGLQPDSELMAPWRQAAPADEALVAALDEIAALEGPLERLDIARKLFVPQLRGVYAKICEHAALHCDGALISTAGSLEFDLSREHRAGGAPPDGAPRRGVVNDAERVLATVGGFAGVPVLRPDWV